jgi:hypothetical protein
MKTHCAVNLHNVVTVAITPGRERNFSSTLPTKSDVTHIILTHKHLTSVRSFDDLAGVDIYVNPLAAAYESLTEINEERAKAGNFPLAWIIRDFAG